jgi:hypothetical protein
MPWCGWMPVNRSLLPMCSGMLLCGCASQQSTLMRRSQALDTTPPPDAALVVFVRDSNPRDTGYPFRLVDESSRFLGESGPSSKFALRVTPGRHAFFAWEPQGDLPKDKYPWANQVGALRATFEAGRTYTVAISYVLPPWRDGRSRFLALSMVDPADPVVTEALQKALPFTPDAAGGQETLNREQASVAEHVALGMSKLGN